MKLRLNFSTTNTAGEFGPKKIEVIDSSGMKNCATFKYINDFFLPLNKCTIIKKYIL